MISMRVDSVLLHMPAHGGMNALNARTARYPTYFDAWHGRHKNECCCPQSQSLDRKMHRKTPWTAGGCLLGEAREWLEASARVQQIIYVSLKKTRNNRASTYDRVLSTSSTRFDIFTGVFGSTHAA